MWTLGLVGDLSFDFDGLAGGVMGRDPLTLSSRGLWDGGELVCLSATTLDYRGLPYNLSELNGSLKES